MWLNLGSSSLLHLTTTAGGLLAAATAQSTARSRGGSSSPREPRGQNSVGDDRSRDGPGTGGPLGPYRALAAAWWDTVGPPPGPWLVMPEWW